MIAPPTPVAHAPHATIAARVVPWTSRRRRFLANLAAVEARSSRLAERLRDAAEIAAAHCDLLIDSNGGHHVRVRLPDGRTHPLYDASADRRSAENGIRIAAGTIPPPILIDGIGCGAHLDTVYRRTERVFLEASSAILVVEHDPALLAIALHLHDWAALLADPRTQLFAGAHAESELTALLDRHPAWPIPEVSIIARPLGPRPWSAEALPGHERLATILDAAAARRAERAAALQAAITARYAGRDAAWWARRYDAALAGRAEPLRVLCVTSRHTTFLQYSMRDCIAALEAHGCRTKLLIEPAPHLRLAPLDALAEQLDFEPDLILLLSRMRYEFSALLHPAPPSCTWDQDNLPWVFAPESRSRFAWNDFLLGIQAAYAPQSLGWPAERCRPCELASSETIYSPQPVAPALLDPLRCDLSYVSHASQPVEVEIDAVRAWLPDDALRRTYEIVLARLLPQWRADGAFPGALHSAIFDACEECWGRLPTDKEFEQLFTATGRIGERAFRHAALEWAADFAERTGRSLRIYGNGWERHPRLGRYAAGPAANGEPLRRIYQASRLNLQLMGWGFVHQRALDGLTAGGCFLARWSQRDEYRARLQALLDVVDRTGADTGPKLAALPATDQSAVTAALTALGTDVRGLTPAVVAATRAVANRPDTVDLLPRFGEMCFRTPTELCERATRLLDDSSLRAELTAAARSRLLERFSYRVRMGEMLEFVRTGMKSRMEPESR